MPFTMPGFFAGSQASPPTPTQIQSLYTPVTSPVGAAAATPAPLPTLAPGQQATSSTNATLQSGAQSGSSRAVVPYNWLGTANEGMSELQDQWTHRGDAFDTTEADQASEQQQARDLATGMAAANNAATTYAAKTRQAGGSGASAGLIKAQGQIAATDAAGKAKQEQARYDVQQREAAATHAGQIATTLANLRDHYLSMLLGHDTANASTESTTGSAMTLSGTGGPAAPSAGPSASSGEPFNPGYIPTFGPITNTMTGSNMFAPRVAGMWRG